MNNELRIIKKHALAFLTALLLAPLAALAADTPAARPCLTHPDPAQRWVLDARFSDEFNAPQVDDAKWDRKMAPWGDRAWTAKNVYQRAGSLFIRATYEPHTVKGNHYFYKLGILRSTAKTTYGYFEARVKGCSRFPGLCPAFWLYSYGNAATDRSSKHPKVTYSEIDIFEIQQGLWHPEFKRAVGPNYIDLNLHARIINAEGKEIWQRPNSLPEACRHGWEAPWNPADAYHIYGCENTPEKITWFIDGKPVAEAKNLYWHLPMSVTFTMELRPPLIQWGGEEGRLPVPEASKPDGFPTEMAVDYVRCWTRSD